MTCPNCKECAGAVGALAPGSADVLESSRKARNFSVWSKSIVVASDGTSIDRMVASVPAAACLDVFIRYRDPQSGTGDPFGSLEQWKVLAVQNQIRSQVANTLTSLQAHNGEANNGFVEQRIFAIRDVPADSFDLMLNLTGVPAGSTTFFDVVIISWGREPTGIGPFELNTFLIGTPATDQQYTGIVTLARDQANGGSDILRGLTSNQVEPQSPDDVQGEGLTNLNVLPVGQYVTTDLALTNRELAPFQLNAKGELRVAISMGPTPSSGDRFTSTAFEAQHVVATPATLRSVFISSKSTDPSFLFLYDRTLAPANGTAPDFPPVPVPSGAPAFLAIGIPEGRKQSNGIVLVMSSTQATLTKIAATDFYFEAHFDL